MRFMVFPLLMLVGCATSEELRRADGRAEYLIACGASTGWGVCYEEAARVCPAGYETLEKDAGFNRKEMRIECPAG